jgi:aspartyl protease family protein
MNDAPGELPRTLKLVTVWLLLGAALFVGVQAWMAQQQRARFSVDAVSGAIELQRGSDGHFHWPGTLNGIAVDFLVDTGATGTAIPQGLAERAGLVAEGSMRSSTAGGVVQGTIARADVALCCHGSNRRCWAWMCCRRCASRKARVCCDSMS